MFEQLRPAYWLLIGLAVVEIALAFGLGQSDIVHVLRTQGLLPMTVAIGLLFPLVWISGLAIAVTRRQVERPTKAIWRMILRHRTWLIRGASFAALVILFARSFSGFKSAMYRLNPFWADPWLADLDLMTFGADPWRLTHAVIGVSGTVVLDRVYILWFFMMFLTLGWFCFTRNPKLQVRGLLCYVLSWGLLGGVSAVAMASVGPCFYEQFYGDDRFAPLMASLELANSQEKLFAFRSMQFLIGSLGEDKFGSGISAMPSLHVTIAFLSYFAIASYSNSRLLKLVSGLFAAAILVGSVHLGWHYAWDGIFGIAAVILFWWGSGKFVDWVELREARNPANPAPIPLPATS